MDYIHIIGLSAALLTTLANIPQTYKIIREKNTEGVSAYTYSILLAGSLLWLVYGTLNDDLPVIIANGITALTCFIILLLNFTSNRIIRAVHKTVLPKRVQEEVRQEVKKAIKKK